MSSTEQGAEVSICSLIMAGWSRELSICPVDGLSLSVHCSQFKSRIDDSRFVDWGLWGIVNAAE